LPKASRRRQHPVASSKADATAPVRPSWSGTISFGLVSIPVNLFTAIRARQTALHLVDESGHALGRRYHCSKDGKELDQDDLVRGYETDEGTTVTITDAELDSVAPELSADIEMRSFVPLTQIPPMYFQRPYFLAPAGKSAKAYHLLAATMQQTGRIGIGSFVMRGHEHLVAIVADNGVLRAATLRYADEIRTPKSIGLPKPGRPPAKRVNEFGKAIDALTHDELSAKELQDSEAAALHDLARAKHEAGKDVIHPAADLESEDAEGHTGGAQIIDLMAVLRKSLSRSAVVSSASSTPPISLAERRARKAGASRMTKKKAVKRK
jgi:DNA end-binding protein Ku